MQVILLKDMGTLGDKHEVVEVKNGYGRNYLIPKGLAIIANKTNLAKLEEIIAKEEAAEAARKDEFQAILDKLKGQTLKIKVKAGTSGKIFGSVTPIQIANAIKEQFEEDIPRKKISLEEDIKELGDYEATLKLHPEVSGNVKLELVQD